MHYRWGQTAAKKKKKKKKNMVTLHNVHQPKKQWKFGSGWFERQQSGVHSFF